MRPILMSIQPTFADKIMAGDKSHEFRKRPIECGTTVVVYRSGHPVTRGIVGTFVAGEVTSGTAHDHFKEVERPGISFSALRAYAGHDLTLIWRIEITDVQEFWTPLNLDAIGIDRAPQSFMYLTDQQVATLRGMAEVPF